MAKDNASLGSCVLVVGDPGSELVQTAVRWAGAARIETISCGSVYEAVARMAGVNGRRVLVVGLIQELARENGAFFQIAGAHAVRCCCLLDASPSAGREDLFAAVHAGATVLREVQDLRGALHEWLTTPPVHGTSHAGREPSRGKGRVHDAHASYEDLRATEAELSALLE